jgi:predicted AlkP superfamily phosphohydrolase/phosphomutase
VDWSKTCAYALGLAGLYLNVKGREAEGIVSPGEEAQRLKDELIARVSGLRDEERSYVGIRELFDTAKLYHGPYLREAPDLLVGFNEGYRTSWDCATGMASGPVFEDNVKAWSGDHIVDPRLVPGVFFCSERIDAQDPGIVDIAPTVLQLFGLAAPAHMDGRPLFERRPGEPRPQVGATPSPAAAA